MMKQHSEKPRIRIAMLLAMATLCLASCKQNEYYTDGGLANPYFNGSILDYLDSKPVEFDSIAQIIRLAGLTDTFNTHEFTFFAPRDEMVKRLLGQVNYDGEDPLLMGSGVNQALYNLGLDTISSLADVDSAIWRKYLERHMFRGRKLLADYPQIDFALLSTFGGENYYAYNNTVSNIGVVFNDAVTGSGINQTVLKYMGYRQLNITYIPNVSQPDVLGQTAKVASSDIQPTNGVVHVLDYTSTFFGFNFEIANEILQSKR